MNNTFSSNMLKIYKDCPKKYKLIYEDKIKLPQDNSFAEEGKNIHALINYYLKGFDISKFTEALTEQELKLWKNFLNLNIKPENIYKSEYIFNVKLENSSWLTGRIDAIKQENSSKYTILDWKTGNLPKNPKKDLQTSVYLYSLYKILKNKKLITDYKNLSFKYINLKEGKEFEVNLDKEKYLKIEQEITQIINNIKIKDYKSNVDDTKCYNCSHKILC